MKVFHRDHGVTEQQWGFIEQEIAKLPDGFFIRRVDLPPDLGAVLCALYGPAMGDSPVTDAVEIQRSPDRPADRMVDLPARPVTFVQVIGIKGAGDETQVFTCYGGPLAPRNPQDPDLKTEDEKREAGDFWAVHALAFL